MKEQTQFNKILQKNLEKSIHNHILSGVQSYMILCIEANNNIV